MAAPQSPLNYPTAVWGRPSVERLVWRHPGTCPRPPGVLSAKAGPLRCQQPARPARRPRPLDYQARPSGIPPPPPTPTPPPPPPTPPPPLPPNRSPAPPRPRAPAPPLRLRTPPSPPHL